MDHVPLPTLAAGLDQIRASPTDDGRIALIIRRPAPAEREELEHGTLDPVEGLLGDSWKARGSRHRTDGSADPAMQLTLMNVRVAALVAGRPERRALAGDQLYVDLDLSYANIPPGTRLRVGTAVVEITDAPHRGCGKFVKRFGIDAQRFVNSPQGRELNLRGVNARVLVRGRVCAGDSIVIMGASAAAAPRTDPGAVLHGDG